MPTQPTYRITGTLTNPQGAPLEGLTVQAFDQDFVPAHPLGLSITDERGFYQITFTDEELRLRSKEYGSVVIILRVYQEGELIHEAQPLYNPDREVTINLTINLPDRSTPPRLSDRKKMRLKNLTLGTTGKKRRARLEKLFTEVEGDFNQLKVRLEKDKEFDTETIQRVTFTHNLSELTEDQEGLVTAFLHNDRTQSLRDIALNFRKKALKELIRATGIPEDADVKDEEERLERFTTRVNDRLFRMVPAAVIHRMVEDEDLAAEDQNVRRGLLTFFKAQPDLDFRKTSILQVLRDPDSMKEVRENNREEVVNHLKKLQRLSSLSPRAEALPILIKAGLTSAYAINEVPMERFVSLFAQRLGGEEIARRIHLNAQNISVRNEHAYVALRQAVLGAPVRMIHGDLSTDARKTLVKLMAEQKNIPINFETLFGSVDLCECEHCNSVYSPAAYLVELFQYLRNNNLDPENSDTGVEGIIETPLENFFRRRPDLGRLQLTCENTNTLIPYIDLVNEVMESFVLHLNDYEEDPNIPKQATIAVYNVEEESSGELLAEPQHTNYRAYRILKDGVYPVCKLPYHQPIDATRQYLNYLGTSRYELFDTFRADITLAVEDNASEEEINRVRRLEELENIAIDRAIAAEYLHLTQEEYVILTKEAFHTREYYELEEEENLSLTQYQELIALKPTWAYYGMDSEDHLLDELKWVKPEKESGMVGFLRRTNILYTDLIALLKTQYVNPNYLSGKALAYMNSLRYSYRFLQSLVDEGETDKSLKYQDLVQFLQNALNINLPHFLFINKPQPFDHDYVECWVYKHFEKIGKLIVLEDASSCKCIEGRIRLWILSGDSGSFIDLTLNADCQISTVNTDPIRNVGHLDTLTGKIVFDPDFADAISITAIEFFGMNGEVGIVEVENMVLHINGLPFTCTDYEEKCDISRTQLKHLDGTDLDTEEYDRLHRFIRLWCKLGWTIEEADQAISGVGEAEANPPTGLIDFKTAKAFVALQPSADTGGENEFAPEPEDDFTANPISINREADCEPEPISQVKQEITPYLIEQLVAVKKLEEITGQELAKLLTYWTPIGIDGENSLYRRLFLKYNLIAVDKVFEEDSFGTYLTQEETISDHLPVLMASLKADTNMVESIMSLAEIPDELTLENVSRLYRHMLLAKTLGLRVNELPSVFALMQDLAYPFEQPSTTLNFYDIFARIEESGFSHRELSYILLNKDDPQRPLQPDMASIFQLAIRLREALLQIETDHPDLEEDQEATEEWLRDKLSLLYDGATVEKIDTLVQGTTIYLDDTRRKFTTQLDETDHGAISAFLLERRKEEEEQPGGDFQTFLPRVQFSGTKGLQITGILSETDQDKVISLAAEDLIEDADARDNFLIAIDKMLAQPERLFDDVLLPIFPQETDLAREVLLAEDIVNTEDQEQDTAFQKRVFLAKAYMPYLREELRQRQVVQMLAANLGLDQEITRALVMEVIKTQDDESIYEEIIRLKEQKDPDEEEQRWQGFFVPGKDGLYTFLLEAEGVATLTFNNQAQWSAPERTDEEGINFYKSPSIFLKADRAYPFTLEGYDEDESGEIIDLFMKFNDQPQVKISDKNLFPALRTEAFREAYMQLQKAAMVVKGFAMKLEEMEFFREYPENFEGLDFNALTFPQWLRMEAFYRLQKSLSPPELTLVEFLRWANQTEDAEGEPSLIEQINSLTGWEKAEIYKLIHPNHFNVSHPEHFRDERNLLRLQHTLQIAHKIGVGIGHLFLWGKPTSRFLRTRQIAGSIRETIRARYSQEEWEEAIEPVHDKLRENQKQALIAYLLAQPVLMEWGVRDADSLFEFFLIDVQMDACMETSRIKQAVSSVQLFVQRCFLGLEDKHGVSSEELDRDRWEWMSRYRVWEANRKVFLYPENWIRPELRDVKSPFFKELESELLQNDVSNETVTNALKRYFVQVDEVANLEVVGQFIEGEGEARKLHVIGKIRNAPYFFYYRNYDFENKYWYPWEKIEVDIPNVDIEDKNGRLVHNGTFVTPVVWNNRLFIFFPQFMQKSWSSPLQKRMKVTDSAENTTMSESSPLTFWEIKMGWSEYKEGKWTPKQLSSEAIYSLRELNENGNIHEFKLFNEQEKFIFAPFIKLNNKLFIQPYYLGKEREVNEELTNDNTSFHRSLSSPTQVESILSQSFEFDGNQIKKVAGSVTDVLPQLWVGHNVFHRMGSEPSAIVPIQAVGSDNNPGDNWSPRFIEENGKHEVFFAENNKFYSFRNDHTKDILGLLRKGEIKRIFDNKILLSDDNYGSNNGIQYHELLRPYAIYNWEALFHSVSLLADHLSKSQRFEEAMTWWHYIFDPIDVKGNIRNVWQFLPFREADPDNVLEQLFNSLDPNTTNEDVTEWRDNPFQPHVIARSRPTAYMKWVVMKYLDNLIAWGDYLFRQDTIESLNQATQLYVLAGHILGPRPEIIPKRGKIQPKSYMDLVDEWDAFSNAMVDLELIFPFSNQIAVPEVSFDEKPHYVNIYGFAATLYFCIPDNPKLLEYWDTIANRLFKIRHCLNIEGIFRKLNLFEPPIDPALLVQAAAQGLSISSVLNDLSTAMPNYRFNYLLQRALEVTSEVKSLGNALLSALEKKDGESLSILRSQHDTRIQNLMMEVRNKQLEEAEKVLESLEENRESPKYRLEHYTELLGGIFIAPNEGEELSLLPNKSPEVSAEGDLLLIPFEVEDLKKAGEAKDKQKAVGITEILAGILHMLPNASVDLKPLGIGSGLEVGGPFFGNATQAIARGLQIRVNELNYESGRAGKKAGLYRQLQERIFQGNLSRLDLMQIDKQITAQKIRKEMAQLEVDNQEVHIEQTQEVEEFIRSKYSNEQLYQWMSDQLKDLYYQTYSFAYDLAKKAETVFRFERGLTTSDFIKFGYWDSAKNGFLAGEQLYLALKQLENAYVETKPHDYEITKHISLQHLNPLALIQLKEEGRCEFDLPEESFDLDYPGHYKRRIKTVSVSIPCIVGPYTSLNCTLRQLKHEFRNSKIAANASDYAKKLEEFDERFVFNPIPTTAIAVSQGQNDSGVFELNFRDERYMPFEGSGAYSSWRLELPRVFHQFDYQTISDVIIHLRYTSSEGGETLKKAALDHLMIYVQNAIELSRREGLFRMLSLRHEFPNEWYQFLHPEPEVENQVFILGRLKDRLPFFARNKNVSNLEVQDFRLFAPIVGLNLSLLRSDQVENLDAENADIFELTAGTPMDNLHQYVATDLAEDLNGYWAIQVDEPIPLTEDILKDSWLVIKYQMALG